MGGHDGDGSYFGRWRWLDGVRAWCDAHDLIFIAAASLGSMLLLLAFIATVALTTMWMRVDSLDSRINRIESAMMKRSESGKADNVDDETLEMIGGL